MRRGKEKEREKNTRTHSNWKLQSRLGHYHEVVSKNKGISGGYGGPARLVRRVLAAEMKTVD